MVQKDKISHQIFNNRYLYFVSFWLLTTKIETFYKKKKRTKINFLYNTCTTIPHKLPQNYHVKNETTINKINNATKHLTIRINRIMRNTLVRTKYTKTTDENNIYTRENDQIVQNFYYSLYINSNEKNISQYLRT